MPDAYDDGVRLLARRPLTRHEVVARLRARGHDDAAIADALDRLIAARVVDDAALARRQVVDRDRGRERALQELVARGVDPEVAAAAWSAAVEEGAIDGRALLRRAVRRRLGPPKGPVALGRLARVYNALLSEGFAGEELEAALAPYGFQRIDP